MDAYVGLDGFLDVIYVENSFCYFTIFFLII